MSDAPTTDTPKKGSRKLLVLALAGVLLAGGAGGGWWFLHHRAADGEDTEQAAAKVKKHAKPLFTTLEPFTVNLQDPRGERFAQIGVTLQFSDPNVETDIKDHLPAIRNEVLMLISSKQLEDLLSTDGKHQLADQIRVRVARAMGVEVPIADEAGAAASAPKAAVEPKVVAEAKAAPHDEDEDEPEEKPKKKRKKHKPAVQNPIDQVLFSQFIVQ